jgi:hypothetical protein
MALYSNQRMDPARMAYLRLLAERQTQDAQQVDTYRDYYEGEQPVSLTQRQRQFIGLKTGQIFCENYCAMVVDSLAERLTVTGFVTGDPAIDAVLWEWWQANRMDAQSGLAHTYAGRDGASYIVVGWNNEERRPEIWTNEAFDDSEGVKVFWQGKPGQGRILFASKRWREEIDKAGEIETMKRMNLYLPDAILKYRSGSEAGEFGWSEHHEAGEEAWPLAWTDDDEKALGVPVVPLLNKRTGISELSNVLPIQDAINKTMIDIVAAADVEGFGIYTKTGGTVVDAVRVFPGAFWQDSDPQAQYGKIEGSQLTGLLETHAAQVKTLAVITRRPMRYFTGGGDATSGESKKQDEAGLVAQAKDATVYFGNAWEDVMSLCAKLDRVFGDGRIPEGVTISCQWADVETRNEDAHRMSVREDFKAGVIDREQAWTELGYSQDTQAAMARRAQVKQAQAVAQAVKLVAAQPTQPTQPAEQSANGSAPGAITQEVNNGRA